MTGLGAAGLATGMAISNPSLEAYESYATLTLGNYLNDALCDAVPPALEAVLGQPCAEMVQTSQAILPQIILDHTQRYNFGLFSLYTTVFGGARGGILPSYQVDTIGVFGRFYTIRTRQTQGKY